MGNERKGFRRYRGFEQRRRLDGTSHGFSRPSRVDQTDIKTSSFAIERFCHGCAHLDPVKLTCNVNPNDQVRYVEGGWCGWASVGGVRGEMTSRGFQRGSKPASPQNP